MANEYNCIDVSEWNGDIDWSRAKNDDVSFALIRCGFGSTGIDKYFEHNVEACIKLGIKFGLYFYSYATDWDSAITEANHCMDLIEPYKDKISFPIFYDVEEERNLPRIADVCMGFINTLNYYGYNVGIYTTGSWYSSYFKNIDTDYIWLAYWGSNDGQPHNKPDYCDIWQFTSRGTVYGVGENCVDCDIVYNTDMKLLINDKPDPDVKKSTFNGTVTITETDKEINIHIIKED